MLNQEVNKREFSLKINNMTIEGVVYGDNAKKPILALHGWLDNAASFELLSKNLHSRKIIGLDLVGHGRSSHRPACTPYYIWDNVTDIYLTMQALSIKKVDLMGHSMGASVAMLFAACFPEMVDKLFLIDGGVPLDYPIDDLPKLMGHAIRQKVKERTSAVKSYPYIQSMITARSQGRFAVSNDAAKRLVERGSKKIEEKYYWSSDPALLLPSLNRMSKQQIEKFLQSVQASTYIYLAKEGLNKNEWREYFDLIQNKTIYNIVGNHHLHMQELGAQEIGYAIDSVNS